MANQWRHISVPPICERMIGFSVPQDDVILVVSYEGMHLVNLSEPVTVETDNRFSEYDCYSPDDGFADYRGKKWNIIGLYTGKPILKNAHGEELRMDSEGLRVSVLKDGAEVWSSSFENFSGDWAAATFSTDGSFIVVGCPCDFDFRIWRRD